MTAGPIKTSLPRLKLLGYSSGNLPITLRNIWRDATLIDTLVRTLPVPAEVIRTVGLRLAVSLRSLPEKTIEGENRARIIALLQEPSLLPEDYHSLAKISFSLFSYTPPPDHYSAHPEEIEKLIAIPPSKGAERYFSVASKIISSSRISYRVVGLYGPMDHLPPDPPHVSLADYRRAEVTALVHMLQYPSPYRLILVPGFFGTGKKTYLLQGVRERLDSQNRKFLYVDVHAAARYTGLKSLDKQLRVRPVAPILILDDVTKLEEKEIRELRIILKDYLRKEGRKVALVGGGYHMSDYQEALLREDYPGLTKKEEITVVPIEVKPLNRRQAKEILTDKTRMSERDKELFLDFVLDRIPPYLSVLHLFTLHEHVMTLDEALLQFEKEVPRELEIALKMAHLESEAGKGRIEEMTKNLRGDIADYLNHLTNRRE